MDQPIDHIEYGHDDGPVPPEFYTRRVLVAAPGSVRVTEWNESGIVLDESFPLSASQFQQLVDALPTFALRNRTPRQMADDEPYPVGGDTEWVVIKSKGELLIGGGDVDGDARGLGQLIESMLPPAGKRGLPVVDPT